MLIYVCKLRFKVRFCLALPSLATFSEAPAGIVVGGESKGESGGKVKGKGGSKGKGEGVWVAFGLRRDFFESFEVGPEGWLNFL
jgi:hypothetical protein